MNEPDNLNELKFKNPKFNLVGTNLTVRRGVKWSGSDGDTVKIFYIIPKRAKILQTKTMRFKDLKDIDLIKEHDPKCTTVKGLYKVMKDVYKNFDKREIITLVFFEFIR